MPRRLSAFMSGHPARAAGGLSCAVHWNSLEQCGIGFRAGERKPGHARRPPSFPGESARWLHRRGMRAVEMTASARACSRVSARPRATMSPPQVTSQYQPPAAPFGKMSYVNTGSWARVTGSKAWVSNSNMTRHPRGHVIPIPARHVVKLMREELGARVQNCSSGAVFLWSKLLTLEFLSATAFRAERHPTMRSGPRDLRCS
jgi:hypothetical protein